MGAQAFSLRVLNGMKHSAFHLTTDGYDYSLPIDRLAQSITSEVAAISSAGGFSTSCFRLTRHSMDWCAGEAHASQNKNVWQAMPYVNESRLALHFILAQTG